MPKDIRMRSKTIFANDAITIFPKDGPDEGVTGRAATPGEEFTTNEYHARELKAAGIAEPLNASDLDGEPSGPLEPHHSISEPELRASRAKFAKAGEQQRPAAAAVTSPARPAAPAPAKV